MVVTSARDCGLVIFRDPHLRRRSVGANAPFAPVNTYGYRSGTWFCTHSPTALLTLDDVVDPLDSQLQADIGMSTIVNNCRVSGIVIDPIRCAMGELHMCGWVCVC